MRAPYGSRVVGMVIDGTITMLTVAVALYVAVHVVLSILPELLAIVGVVAGIAALTAIVIFIAKVRRERW